VAAILLDLGVSSRQLDAAHRGFAIKHPDAPLDMRMDPTRGVPALALVDSLELSELARILRDFGEVRDAHRIADRIKEAASAGRLATTGELARLVEREVSGRKLAVHPATLVFQALRIAVNDELGALDAALASAPEVLAPDGRLVIMSYHSLEDRRVKHTFIEGERGPPRPARLPPPSDWRPTWKVLTRQAITADEGEVAQNPRARSARLRAAAYAGGERGAA
jgi:16S rRNA (cytosine1402-N4)-methyltransferase